jgi:inward rectifier potassium channel
VINKDGSFNVRRTGGSLLDSGIYLWLMSLSWPQFLSLIPTAYFSVNLLFASIYYSIGMDQFNGSDTSTAFRAFASAFFFSVQTLTTVGYGHIAPRELVPNFVAAVEAMLGLLGFTVATGLLYGRFSRPSACIRFSANALVAPFQNGRAIMFRIANVRSNILMDLEATMLMMTVERGEDGSLRRRYSPLELERPKVYFMPMSWTLVHPLAERSPLRDATPASLAESQTEFLILVRAFDDTFSQVVHARHSYTWEEVVWGARFLPAFDDERDGTMMLELDRLDLWESVTPWNPPSSAGR